MNTKDTPSPSRASRVLGLVLLATAACAALFLWALSVGGALSRALAGVPDGGASVAWGLPTARLLAETSAVLAVGFLIGALALSTPDSAGRLTAVGRHHARAAGWAGMGWAAASLVQVLFTAADLTGRSVNQVDVTVMLSTAWYTPQGRALLVAAMAGLVVAGCARWARRPSVLLVGLVGAALGVVAVAFAGHAATSVDHNTATTSLSGHIVAASVWVGGLAALCAHARWDPAGLPFAAARFSRVALACFVVVAATGLLNAWLRTGSLDNLAGTGYGLLLQLKLLAAGLLGGLGWWHRRRSLPGLAAASGTGRRLFARLIGVELAVMAGTVVLAVALSRAQPPGRAFDGEMTLARVLLGYAMPPPPTAARLLLDWRPDLFFLVAVLGAGAAYLAAVWRLRRAGVSWPLGRTACWLAGLLIVLAATGSGLARYGPVLFSIHMVQHMLASMAAPILLVLGAPITLALRALPAARSEEPPGWREWITAALSSRPVRLFTHPIVAAVLWVGGLYVMYFGGLYEYTLRNHPAHIVMYVHFIGSGVLFFAVLIGLDPLPRRLPYPARLGLLLMTLAAHAFFGVALMQAGTVIAADWYADLARPWGPDPLTDQRNGGGIAWAIGEAPAAVVAIILFRQWIRADEREQRRLDRAADRDGDAALVAYNDWLAATAATTSAPQRVSARKNPE